MLSFSNPVNGGDRYVMASKGVRCPTGGIEGKADADELTCNRNEVLFVLIPNRQVSPTFGGDRNLGGQSCLEVGQIGPLVRAVDLTSGLHFRAGSRVESSQFDEREHRRLDAHLAGSTARDFLTLQGLTDGDSGCDAGEWKTGGLRNERHGA